MADLIDREKLLKEFDKLCDLTCKGIPAPHRLALCGSCLLGDAMGIVETFQTTKRGSVKKEADK